MELRSATTFPGGHVDDVDYIAWNPTHPELFCTSSQKDRRIVFWDGRREQTLFSYVAWCSATDVSPSRKPSCATDPAETRPCAAQLLPRREVHPVHYYQQSTRLAHIRKGGRGDQRPMAGRGHVQSKPSSVNSPGFSRLRVRTL